MPPNVEKIRSNFSPYPPGYPKPVNQTLQNCGVNLAPRSITNRKISQGVGGVGEIMMLKKKKKEVTGTSICELFTE